VMSWDSGFAVDLPNKLVATDTALNPKQTDTRHVIVARADEQLAHAYEQVSRANEQIARADEQLSKLEHDAARHPSDHSQARYVSPCSPGQPAIAWRAGGTRLHWLNVDSVHRGRCHRLAVAVLRRCGEADYREVGVAVRPDFIARARRPGAPRGAELTYHSGGHGEDSTSTTSSSGSDRTGWRRADRRRRAARVDAVAPVDGT